MSIHSRIVEDSVTVSSNFIVTRLAEKGFKREQQENKAEQLSYGNKSRNKSERFIAPRRRRPRRSRPRPSPSAWSRPQTCRSPRLKLRSSPSDSWQSWRYQGKMVTPTTVSFAPKDRLTADPRCTRSKPCIFAPCSITRGHPRCPI